MKKETVDDESAQETKTRSLGDFVGGEPSAVVYARLSILDEKQEPKVAIIGDTTSFHGKDTLLVPAGIAVLDDDQGNNDAAIGDSTPLGKGVVLALTGIAALDEDQDIADIASLVTVPVSVNGESIVTFNVSHGVVQGGTAIAPETAEVLAAIASAMPSAKRVPVKCLSKRGVNPTTAIPPDMADKTSPASGKPQGKAGRRGGYAGMGAADSTMLHIRCPSNVKKMVELVRKQDGLYWRDYIVLMLDAYKATREQNCQQCEM